MMQHQSRYKTRRESDEIARRCGTQCDLDRSNTITINEFYPLIQALMQSEGLYREVTPIECEQLFRFYDDDRNGFLTLNEIQDIAWDIYTGEVMNDRVVMQQLLQRIIVEKIYNRGFGNFNDRNMYGRWGKTNQKGNWRNYRFNPYQFEQMKTYQYPFNTINPMGGMGGMQMGNNQMGNMQMGNMQMGGMVNNPMGGMQMGNMQMGGVQMGVQMGGVQMGGVQMGGMQRGVINMQGGMQGGVINMQGGMQRGMQMMPRGMPMQGNMQMNGMMQQQNMGQMNAMMQQQNMGQMNAMMQQQNMGQMNAMMQQQNMGQMNGMMQQQRMRGYHRPDMQGQYGTQQMMLDPFSWNEMQMYGTNSQQIVLPSPSQLQPHEQQINLNVFSQALMMVQPQQIYLVAPIRFLRASPQEIYNCLMDLPMWMQQNGLGAMVHFNVLFGSFVNLIESRY